MCAEGHQDVIGVMFACGVSMITELGHRVALKLLEVEEILENRSKKRES